MTAPVRIVVCRVGRAAAVERLATDERDSGLAAMQAIVGGTVTRIVLDDGLDLYSNDDALNLGLPLNRIIPGTAPRLPVDADVIWRDAGLAEPGELGEWRIHGDFFIARGDNNTGELVDLTDEDIERYTAMFDFHDFLAIIAGLASPAPDRSEP